MILHAWLLIQVAIQGIGKNFFGLEHFTGKPRSKHKGHHVFKDDQSLYRRGSTHNNIIHTDCISIIAETCRNTIGLNKSAASGLFVTIRSQVDLYIEHPNSVKKNRTNAKANPSFQENPRSLCPASLGSEPYERPCPAARPCHATLSLSSIYGA